MNKETIEYGDETLTYYTTKSSILIDTADLCRIAGISNEDRRANTDLNMPTIDCTTASVIVEPYNSDFSQWLIDTFADHDFV